MGMNQTSPIQAFVILQTVPFQFCTEKLLFHNFSFPGLVNWNQDDFLSVASLTCSHLREPGREKSLSFGTAAKEHQITVQPETQTQLLQSVCQILRFDVQGCRVFFFSLGSTLGVLGTRFAALPTVKKLVFVKRKKACW